MEDLILTFIFGVAIGWLWHTRAMTKKLLRDTDQMIEMLKRYKESKEAIDQVMNSDGLVELRVSKENNQYYLYSNDGQDFVSQGITVESALEAARVRFPKQSFAGIIPKEQAKEWGLSKQD